MLPCTGTRPCARLASLLAASACFAAILLTPGVSRASDPTAPKPLLRSPVLLSTSMPDDVRCAYDEDGNGLDDEVEFQIADTFAPALYFDQHENSLRSDEPHVLYSILRIEPNKLQVKYLFLWEWDGGFQQDPICMTAHRGDTQVMDMFVELQRGSSGWFAKLASLSGFENVNNVFVGGDPALALTEDGRPVVYPSADKHHFYYNPGLHYYGDSGPPFQCDDFAYGDGDIRISQDLRHAPLLLSGSDFPWMVFDDGTFGNVCKYLETGTWEKVGTNSWSVRNNHLDDWGYHDYYEEEICPQPYQECVSCEQGQCCHEVVPDCYIQTTTGSFSKISDWKFYDADGIIMKIHWWYGFAERWLDGWDGDMDQIADRMDSCPLTAHQPGTVELDVDGDALTGDCDPGGYLKHRYVAGGNKDHLPRLGSLNAGFLDSDRDEIIDGDDLCPSSAGSGLDSNSWGEERNLKELQNDDREGGSYRRADRCDPYPATGTRWLTDPTSEGTVGCEKSGNVETGADVMQIEARLSAGVSDNDPIRDQPTWTAPARTFKGNTYRCACRGFDGEECLNNELSECYRGDVSPPIPGFEVWYGWRAVERPFCSHDALGFCEPYEITVAPMKVAQLIDWHWTEEMKLAGHFAPGGADFETDSAPVLGSQGLEQQPHLRSKYKYALWTQTEEGAAFAKAPGPLPFGQGSHSNLHRDPEEADPALLNIKGIHSRRLRGSHATGLELIASHSQAQINVGVPCPTLPSGWSSGDMARAYWRSKLFGTPTIPGLSGDIIPGRPSPPTPWLALQAASQRMDSARLLPQGEKSWYSFSPNILSTDDTWMTQSPGKLALMAPTAAGGVGQRSAPPGVWLLWVEQAATNPRWTLFTSGAPSDLVVPLYSQVGGSLSESTLGTTMVSDELGAVAALVDPATGKMRAFDMALGRWLDSPALLQAVAGRQGVAATLVAERMFVLGGKDAAGVHSDGLVVDVFGGSAESLHGLPARKGARAMLSNDQEAILLYGGADASGVVHDDVWALPTGPARSGGATLLRGDTAAAGSVDASRVTLSGTSDGADLVRVRQPDPGSLDVVVEVRTDHGWVAADEEGQPLQTADCSTQDDRGGELCLEGEADWWKTPGIRPCSEQGQAAACPGGTGTLTRSWSVPDLSLGAAAEVDGAWVLRGNYLERWSHATSAPKLLAKRMLGHGSRRPASASLIVLRQRAARAYDLAMGSGTGLVLTDAGVQVFRPTHDGFALGPVLPICGTPLRVSYMGEGRFVVGTTVGVAVVESADGDRAMLKAMTLLRPGTSAHTLEPVDVSVGSIAACSALGARPSATQLELMSRAMPLASLGPSRFLAARDGALFDIEYLDGVLRARGKPLASDGLFALRGDLETGRVYGLGRSGHTITRPVFDARRDELVLLGGSHDLQDWLTRSERGAVTVRLVNGRARVAEVVR